MARKWCVVVVLVVSQLFSTIFPMMDFRNFNGCSALLGWAQKSWSPAALHSWLPRVLKTGVNFVSVVWRCQPVGGGGNSPARGGIQPWVGVFFSSPGFFFPPFTSFVWQPLRVMWVWVRKRVPGLKGWNRYLFSLAAKQKQQLPGHLG